VATAADASDLDALTELADRRLYAAKRAGRDRVVA
jgi:PleD family two-component response regulator